MLMGARLLKNGSGFREQGQETDDIRQKPEERTRVRQRDHLKWPPVFPTQSAACRQGLVWSLNMIALFPADSLHVKAWNKGFL